MNYKEVIQYLNFPDYQYTRQDWEYIMLYINTPCYNIQDLANLITDYGVGIEELKLNLLNVNQAVVMFKKGGSFREDFPGQVTIAEYSEDTPSQEST